MAANLGQSATEADALAGLRERALQSGASKVLVEDLRKEFVTDYLWPLVKSGAKYEGNYLLGTAIACPLIARRQVELALEEGADAVVHGCAGNDQVRFELAYKTLAPELTILPTRGMGETIDRQESNLWHLCHEGGILEDPSLAPPQELFERTEELRDCPDGESEITIDFVSGTPVGLNGKKIPPVQLIEDLNEIGGTNGIGRVDLVENAVSGTKSRGVYETPGGTLIMAAHRELESLSLDRQTRYHKDILSITYAQLVYDGHWYTPLREALDAFIAKTQDAVTGSVTLSLYRGNMTVKSRNVAPFPRKYETLARTV
jgi:argininosuccinate synthase